MFFYNFISYIASYVGTTQTGFLMAFLPRFRQNRNHDSCSKRATGTEKKRNPEDSCRNRQPRPENQNRQRFTCIFYCCQFVVAHQHS